MPSSTPTLPATYYDLMLQRPPLFMECVHKDLAHIEHSGIVGPFGSTDEFSVNYDTYHNDAVQHYKKILNQKMDAGLIKDSATREHLISEYLASDTYNMMQYSIHAEYLTMVNFLLFGKKTFYIQDNIAKSLSFTDLEVDSHFLRLPFKSCLFVYTSPVAISALHAIEGEERTEPDYLSPVSVFLMERPAEEGLFKIVMACWHASQHATHMFIKRELLVKEGWKLSEAINTDWRDIYKSEFEGKETIDEEMFYEGGFSFFRMVLNSVLYLSTNDPDVINCVSAREMITSKAATVPSVKKRRLLVRRAERSSFLNYSSVGSHIQPITIDKSGPRSSPPDALASKLPVMKRFVVRGHWRHQAHGQSAIQRKLIWIEPYYKGPELGELINKPYKLKYNGT